MKLSEKLRWRLFKYKFQRQEVAVDKKIGGEALNKTLPSKHSDEGANDTQSTDYRLLKPMFDKIPLDDKDVFVDIGCGQGRVLSYLITEKAFGGKLIGIELSEDVAEFARKRFVDYPNVQIITGNAVESIPSDATVFYLFNPFNEEVMKAFLDSLETIIRHPAIVIYGFPVHHAAFDGRGRFSLKEVFTVKREFIENDAQIAIYDYRP